MGLLAGIMNSYTGCWENTRKAVNPEPRLLNKTILFRKEVQSI